ncbi:MFS transporter [Microbispora sp. H10836]|uniref:MFS transporter n=1 Tax=Microbispora sp. H10836 TaxID=2729106 RepID=UPI0014748271|nr:MFS transporter [Microbispora sp. H10836]
MAAVGVFDTLKTRKMSAMQWWVVATGLFLVLMDGYDISLTSFASPYIADDFGITSKELGMAMSGALVGLFIGAVALAPLGDRIGRRATGLLGAYIVAIGMAISTFADGVAFLALGRIVTGAGIGTLIAVVAVLFSEYVNARVYPIVMTGYAAGIPIGTFLGSTFVGPMLHEHGWRFAFGIGLGGALLSVVLVHLLLPESLAYIASSRKRGAIERFNRLLGRMGLESVSALPQEERLTRTRAPFAEVLRGRLLRNTMLSSLAYFLFMVGFYFTTNWAAKYMADVTHDRGAAAGTMSWYGIGGVIGVLVFGAVIARRNLYRMTAIVIVLGGVLLVVFGQAATVQTLPFLAIAATSFFLSASTTGFYAAVPLLYPEKVRSTGYGLVMGVGRIGGIIAPTLGGAFFDAGVAPRLTFTLFALPLVLSAIVLLFLHGHVRRVSTGVEPATALNAA